MRCQTCGREYQTYNGICPFCKGKNQKDTQEQPSIKYTPIVKTDPQISTRPRNPTGNTNSNELMRTGKNSDNVLKYALTGGIVLLVVILAAATVQSFIGGSSSPSNPDIYTAPTPTDVPIPSLAPIISTTQPKITYSGSNAGTLSPYSGDSDSTNPNRIAPDYTAPGSRSGNVPPTENAPIQTQQNVYQLQGDGNNPQDYIPLSIPGFLSNQGLNGPIDNGDMEGGTSLVEIMYHPSASSKYYSKFDYLLIQVIGFENDYFAEKTYQEVYRCDQPLTIAGRQVTYEFDGSRGQTNICWRDKNIVILVGTGPFSRDTPNEQAQKEANIYAVTFVPGSSSLTPPPSTPKPIQTSIPTTVKTSIPTSNPTSIPTTFTPITTTVTITPTISSPSQSWTSDDIKFVRYFYAYLATIQRHSTDIINKACSNDTVGVRYASDRLKRTTEEGISNIEPLTVSPPLTQTKTGYLSYLHSMASGSDYYVAAMDAYEQADMPTAESLVGQGAKEFAKAGEALKLIDQSLPKELAEPY